MKTSWSKKSPRWCSGSWRMEWTLTKEFNGNFSNQISMIMRKRGCDRIKGVLTFVAAAARGGETHTHTYNKWNKNEHPVRPSATPSRFSHDLISFFVIWWLASIVCDYAHATQSWLHTHCPPFAVSHVGTFLARVHAAECGGDTHQPFLIMLTFASMSFVIQCEKLTICISFKLVMPKRLIQSNIRE